MTPGWVSSSLPKTRVASLTLFQCVSIPVSAHVFKLNNHILVGSVDILNSEDSEVSVVTEISEGDSGTGLDSQLLDVLLINVEVDGHGKEVAIDKAVVLNDA